MNIEKKYKYAGAVGLIVILSVIAGITLYPTDYRAILGEYPNATYIVLDFEQNQKLEVLTRGPLDYIRWKYDIDKFTLYSGRYIGAEEDWLVYYKRSWLDLNKVSDLSICSKVTATRCYVDNYYEKLARKVSLIKLYFSPDTDKITIIKETPYYGYSYASGSGGTLIQKATITSKSPYYMFPENYEIEWLPASGRENSEYKLVWRIQNLEFIDISPNGYFDNVSEVSFGKYVKITWKDAMKQFDFGYANKSQNNMLIYFKPNIGTQNIFIRIFDPVTITCLLNGTSINRYYENGQGINITGTTSSGSVCLSIDAYGYGNNYTCGANSVNINFAAFTNNFKFNDSSIQKNLSFGGIGPNETFSLNFHANDSIINASLNLTGFEGWGFDKSILNTHYYELILKDVFLNDTYFWTAGTTGGIKRFTSAGVYDNFAFDPPTSPWPFATSLIFNNTYFWVLTQGDYVFRHLANGTYDNWNFSANLSGTETNTEGLAFNNTYFWVIGRQTKKVYRYLANGTYDNWNFSTVGDGYGIYYYDNIFWTLEQLNGYRQFCNYDNSGNFIGCFKTNYVDDLHGLYVNGTYIWTTDGDENVTRYTKIYPNSIKIYINGILSNFITGDLIEGEKASTEFNDTSSATNITITKSESKAAYIQMQKNSIVNSAYLNLSAFQSINFINSVQNYSGGAYNENILFLANNATHIWVWRPTEGVYNLYQIRNITDGTLKENWYPSCGYMGCQGIYTNNTYIWIIQYTDYKIMRFTMNKVNDYNISLHATNTYPVGLIVVENIVYVIDNSQKKLFKYNANDGSYLGTIDVGSCVSGLYPNLLIDIAHIGSTFYINDYWNNRICKFENYGQNLVTIYDTFDSSKGQKTDVYGNVAGITYHSTTSSFYLSDNTVEGTQDKQILRYNNSFPSDLYLDVGGDGDAEWIYSGQFNQANNRTNDFSSEMNDYLDVCNPDSYGFCDVPLVVYAAIPGTIQLSDLQNNYSIIFNPVILNSTLINNYLHNSNGYVDIPFNISSATAGIVQVSGSNIPYYGSQNITVKAHTPNYDTNDTQFAYITYSNFSVNLPRFVPYLEFMPKTNSSKNVTPYGQTNSIPIFNISSKAYDKAMNVSIHWNTTNETILNCANITLSVDNTKSIDDILLTNSSQTIISNLVINGNQSLWAWLDMDNCLGRWIEVNLVWDSCCYDCMSCW